MRRFKKDKNQIPHGVILDTCMSYGVGKGCVWPYGDVVVYVLACYNTLNILVEISK
jgi:hypothetical protein